MSEITIDIGIPDEIIKQQIEAGSPQKSIAMIYALALRNKHVEPDWLKINNMIIDRWSISGLERIKKMAWSGSCFPTVSEQQKV